MQPSNQWMDGWMKGRIGNRLNFNKNKINNNSKNENVNCLQPKIVNRLIWLWQKSYIILSLYFISNRNFFFHLMYRWSDNNSSYSFPLWIFVCVYYRRKKNCMIGMVCIVKNLSLVTFHLRLLSFCDASTRLGNVNNNTEQ